ncbi:hypothetical protein LguiA_036625 [Lonicera macranthoides]
MQKSDRLMRAQYLRAHNHSKNPDGGRDIEPKATITLVKRLLGIRKRAWINDHFSECVRVVPNMEYTELMPRMCKWKAQQCCGDTCTALIVLREKIDDLTEIDQVEVDRVIAFLQGAFSNGQVEDNSSVTYEALKMLLDARKTEKAQGNIPAMESRRKRQHEPTDTTAVTKGKAISKKKPKK